jgi:PadR family transcriptional regulator PadR
MIRFKPSPSRREVNDPPRITMNLLKVLVALLADPTTSHYGTEIGKAARLSGGSLYPLLLRLEQAGVLESDWEQVDPSEVGRPRRRLYRLTGEGAEYARRTLQEAQQSLTPSFGRIPGFPVPGGASA